MVDLPAFVRPQRQHVQIKTVAIFKRRLTWVERVLVAIFGGTVV